MHRKNNKLFTNHFLRDTLILKKFTFLLCLCLVIFSLTSCGNNNSIESASNEIELQDEKGDNNNDNPSISDDSDSTVQNSEEETEVSADVAADDVVTNEETTNTKSDDETAVNNEEVSAGNSQYPSFNTYTVSGYLVVYDGNNLYWSHEDYMSVNNDAIACIKLDQPITVDNTAVDLLMVSIYASSEWPFGDKYEGKHATITGIVSPNKGDPQEMGVKYSIVIDSYELN